jgi:pimeloyl-ACP methyl ester carboxylesterase
MSPDTSRRRRPLLFLHGALGSEEQFFALSRDLRDIAEPILLTFEGHGSQPFDADDFTTERFLAQVKAVLDSCHGDEIDIFGYSLGGYIGLMAALQYPDRVRSVYILATKFYWSHETAERECAMLEPSALLEKSPRFAETLRLRHTAIGWTRNLELTRRLLYRFGSQSPIDPADLPRIASPVRVAVGDNDHLVSIRECAELAHQLPMGDCEVFPRTPHPFERVPFRRLVFSLREWLCTQEV